MAVIRRCDRESVPVNPTRASPALTAGSGQLTGPYGVKISFIFVSYSRKHILVTSLAERIGGDCTICETPSHKVAGRKVSENSEHDRSRHANVTRERGSGCTGWRGFIDVSHKQICRFAQTLPFFDRLVERILGFLLEKRNPGSCIPGYSGSALPATVGRLPPVAPSTPRRNWNRRLKGWMPIRSKWVVVVIFCDRFQGEAFGLGYLRECESRYCL